jgi:hypothetical protein
MENEKVYIKPDLNFENTIADFRKIAGVDDNNDDKTLKQFLNGKS